MNERKWAKYGHFPTITDLEKVRCGVCTLAFDTPQSKADHLAKAHAARVTTRTFGPLNIEEFVWYRL